METEKAKMLTTLKQKIDTDADNPENFKKMRFALFSQPLAGTISDGNFDFSRTKNLGEDGRVKTKPRQIYGGQCRTGKGDKAYITKPAYITVNDPYKDQGQVERIYNKSRQKALPHEAAFKPASGTKSDPNNTLNKWIPRKDASKKPNYRNADGKVITQPRPIFTNPPKTGSYSSTVGHLFSKQWGHVKDEYDRKRELDYKESQEARNKLQKEPFKTTEHGNKTFNTDRRVFGLDKPIEAKKPRPQSYTPAAKHEGAFRPSNPGKKGLNGAFSKWPEYKGNPVHVPKRATTAKGEKKEPFKTNYPVVLNRPTPSISLNKANLKSDLRVLSAKLM